MPDPDSGLSQGEGGKAVERLRGDTFDGAVHSAPGVYFVEFEADWCAPCRAYAPVIEEVARERGGRVGFGRVDITAEPGLAERCGVATVPSVVVFRSGEIVKRIFGARTKRYLLSELDLLDAREGDGP